MRNVKKMNEAELRAGVAGEKKSWHDVYKKSAWIYVGGLSFELSEGDVIAVFSQYGEIVNMNLVRDAKTGKSRGFAFICYEDQRSTVLAVDNLNGIKLTGRIIRVDHVADYKPPKEKEETDEFTKLIYDKGCAPDINIRRLEKEADRREY